MNKFDYFLHKNFCESSVNIFIECAATNLFVQFEEIVFLFPFSTIEPKFRSSNVASCRGIELRLTRKTVY